VPYANSHVKVTIIGDMFNGNEEWSTGFRIGSEDEGSGNFDVPQDWVDDVRDAWETFFEDSTSGVSNYFRTTTIKASVVLEAGNVDVDTVKTSNYTTPIYGGASGTVFPPQIALVAQLAAASPVGLGSKGRMYLPGVNFTLDANGYISGTNCTNVAENLRDFFDAIETATNSPGYIINASKGRPGVPFTAPVNKRVASVRVGSVYDTQRRRRNALTESYSSAALAS